VSFAFQSRPWWFLVHACLTSFIAARGRYVQVLLFDQLHLCRIRAYAHARKPCSLTIPCIRIPCCGSYPALIASFCLSYQALSSQLPPPAAPPNSQRRILTLILATLPSFAFSYLLPTVTLSLASPSPGGGVYKLRCPRLQLFFPPPTIILLFFLPLLSST
jgi:hypothetical protein